VYNFINEGDDSMNLLKQIRESKRKTQYDVAKAADIQPQKVSEFECGRRDLRLGEAIKVAKFLGVSLNELTGYEGSGKSDR
jgi:transcriptional regulator with XRE-family HTH domain